MKRGFTALELVVVLVIVAILGAMLVPMLDQARTEAVRTKCLGRIRQVALAFEMYQMGHQGEWPSARLSVCPQRPDGADPTASLAVLYPEYASKTYLFQCPAAGDVVILNDEGNDFRNCEHFDVPPGTRVARGEPDGRRPPYPPSYFYDCAGPGSAPIPRDAPPTRVVYGDECVHGYWEDDSGKGFWLGQNNHPAEGGSFLFADKHVAWLPVEWTGAPYKKGSSEPYVPNLQARGGVAGGLVIYQDTNVFADDTPGDDPDIDADLAGMMWVGAQWLEF